MPVRGRDCGPRLGTICTRLLRLTPYGHTSRWDPATLTLRGTQAGGEAYPSLPRIASIATSFSPPPPSLAVAPSAPSCPLRAPPPRPQVAGITPHSPDRGFAGPPGACGPPTAGAGPSHRRGAARFVSKSGPPPHRHPAIRKGHQPRTSGPSSSLTPCHARSPPSARHSPRPRRGCATSGKPKATCPGRCPYRACFPSPT